MKKQPNCVFFPKYNISMFLLNRKKTKQHNQTKETERSKAVQDKALVILGHDLIGMTVQGSPPEPSATGCCVPVFPWADCAAGNTLAAVSAQQSDKKESSSPSFSGIFQVKV